MMDGPSLPRSIRWRLQLGLLALPSSEKDAWSTEELYTYNVSLLHDQRTRYQELVEKYEVHQESTTEEEEEDDKPEAALAERSDEATTAAALDPLTAIVREQEAQAKRRRELELKYRKERARRNRGIYQGESESPTNNSGTDASLEVIDKDLHRLQPEHFTYHHSRKRLLQEGNDDFDISVKERTAQLAELLHVHAREHSDFGYRQGQHELASYLLLVLEMDLYDIESALQSSGRLEEKQESILDAVFLVHDAFTMFERVMSNLWPAYDVKQTMSQASSPMEEMGRSVVAKLKSVVCDQALYDVVKAMHCPPELYCTRWVRLMFSREVLGWRNVLLLWDIFFDLVTCHESITSMDPSKYTKPGISPQLQLGRFTLMQVLESTAASMILLQREALLEADPNESIQILMNVPPLKNVVPLTATLLSLMRRLQVGPDGLMTSTSISSLSASFGKMARGAFQQIESTAGESIRSLYDSTTASRLGLSKTPESSSNAVHPLQATEASPQVSVADTDEQHVKSNLTLADTLYTSTSTITDFLMEAESNRGTKGVPEHVWEALAQVETVRKQLLHMSQTQKGPVLDSSLT